MAKSQGNDTFFQERFYLQGLSGLGSEKITHSSHHSAHKASPSRSTLIARHKEKERYMNRSQPAETQTRHRLPSHLPIPINNHHKPYALAPRALQFLVASPEESLNIIESFSTFRYHYSYGYCLLSRNLLPRKRNYDGEYFNSPITPTSCMSILHQTRRVLDGRTTGSRMQQ